MRYIGSVERLHRSILVSEIIEILGVSSGRTYVDATFGEGGHSGAILEKGGKVLGLDRDEEALKRYLDSGSHRNDPNLRLIHGRMGEIEELFGEENWDGALVDLGVSTRQILSAERGFTFQASGPLDMRMDSTQGKTLADILSTISERELADALYQFGEIRTSRRLSARLLNGFQKGLITNTGDLVKLMPQHPAHTHKTHPATQLFMALRMLVNGELEEITLGLPAIFKRIKPGAKLCVITFHSVEDRVVKRIFKTLSGQCVCGQDPCHCPREKKGELISKKPILPSEQELRDNPRARSAKLRCIEKISS